MGHFPPIWPIGAGSFGENDLYYNESYDSSPPCTTTLISQNQSLLHMSIPQPVKHLQHQEHLPLSNTTSRNTCSRTLLVTTTLSWKTCTTSRFCCWGSGVGAQLPPPCFFLYLWSPCASLGYLRKICLETVSDVPWKVEWPDFTSQRLPSRLEDQVHWMRFISTTCFLSGPTLPPLIHQCYHHVSPATSASTMSLPHHQKRNVGWVETEECARVSRIVYVLIICYVYSYQEAQWQVDSSRLASKASKGDIIYIPIVYHITYIVIINDVYFYQEA